MLHDLLKGVLFSREEADVVHMDYTAENLTSCRPIWSKIDHPSVHVSYTWDKATKFLPFSVEIQNPLIIICWLRFKTEIF